MRGNIPWMDRLQIDTPHAPIATQIATVHLEPLLQSLIIKIYRNRRTVAKQASWRKFGETP
jgi:hypothetical protein